MHSSKNAPRPSRVNKSLTAVVTAIAVMIVLPSQLSAAGNDTSTTATSTTLPVGCGSPTSAQAVFVGTVVERTEIDATFRVDKLRAGTLTGFADGGDADGEGAVVKVRYGRDVSFLDLNGVYLVGTVIDTATSLLSSSVRDNQDLFGGNQIAGIDESVLCPQVENPGRTLLIDGQPVDTAILSSFFDQPLRLFMALVLPMTLVFVVLVALVFMRRAARLAPHR
ncbi:MAG: hypothetical protein LW606_07830 [Ilumatobacteraceae bacterium]|nr:hypothetical protein [Ilumatobacteraceae bacterium]